MHITKLLDAGVALTPSQAKLCIPIINRLYIKMANGIKFASITVDGDVISNGHHRYIASLLAEYEIGKVPGVVSKNVVIGWESVVFEEEEWEEPDQIHEFNVQDAAESGISLEIIMGLLK
ncbi:hypothetical protein DXN05_19610 [Deminuibacter soli]|uniref:ParB/Sulfiredoxin domain-containing protein n=2 Tax=Deminuibacter soli TaxID=2291815 RepID=A0A3E1NEM9_9BACT|nr:hypothetical protein DXN05_19610 [Deminuibacter soli]